MQAAFPKPADGRPNGVNKDWPRRAQISVAQTAGPASLNPELQHRHSHRTAAHRLPELVQRTVRQMSLAACWLKKTAKACCGGEWSQ